jgi:hypothetical protein
MLSILQRHILMPISGWYPEKNIGIGAQNLKSEDTGCRTEDNKKEDKDICKEEGKNKGAGKEKGENLSKRQA